jgi:H+/Cl- antiporter ClcA
MTPTIAVIGIVVAACGLFLEALGVIAGSSYGLRRRLPVKSPLDFVTFGGILFALGLATHLFGSWLVR